MQNRRYIWDDNKHDININKHGIDFFEATTVFEDPNALYLFDEDHSIYEDRFIVIGMSENNNTLMVCHCYRNDDTFVRLISARKANKYEITQYRGGMG